MVSYRESIEIEKISDKKKTLLLKIHSPQCARLFFLRLLTKGHIDTKIEIVRD